MTVEALTGLADKHGYDLTKSKTFNPKKFPGYTRVWGDKRDDGRGSDFIEWDCQAQQLTFKKRSPVTTVPASHRTLRTAGKCLGVESVPRILTACVQYRCDRLTTVNSVHTFVRDKFRTHIHNVQTWLGSPQHSLMLSYMPLDSHPRKLAFDLAGLLEKLLCGEFGALTADLVNIDLPEWKVACCVQVSSPRRPLFLIHVLAPQETELRGSKDPTEFCRFKTAVLLIDNKALSCRIRQRHCESLGLQVEGRQVCRALADG